MAADDTRKVIGGFRVLKDLKAGAGSQGTVYQAVCEVARFPSVAVGDVVALKVMAVQDDDGEAFARLEKRTAGLVALEHPNVVRYHGCFREPGPFNDVHVLVLEFVEGRSLKDLLAAAPCGLGADEAMRIAFGLIDGLIYTSGRGIVHRDIKPANVIVQPDGTPKLIDFEVARRANGTATVGGSNMVGTFDYMAPDFTEAEFRGDVLSDIFSLGVCLHEMLTGRTPYRRQSETSTQANIAFLQRWLKAGTSANPLKVSTRVGKLLPGARDVLERALAPDRANRLPDFQTFRAALSRARYRELAHGDKVWRLLNYIGHGGFGEVFGAVDRATGQRVAVKHLLNESGIDRFRREANALRRVSDSGFPRYIDSFTAEDGDAFLVMEYLDGMPGQSLKDILRAKGGERTARDAVLTAFVRYARALADLHALGLVHRDIKPANLYFPVATPDRAVVMDLGIARDLGGTATVGQVPGTIDYMPPECATGQTRGGPEADVWALGLCLYEAVSGKTAYPRLPDGSAAFEAYFLRVKKNVKPDFSGVSDDPKLRALLEEMCALDPKKRIRDVRRVEYQLRLLNGENPDNLPVPTGEFKWCEASADADFADADPSISGATMETVWGSESALTRARSDFLRGQRAQTRHRALMVLLPIVALLVAGGAFMTWRIAERQRQEELARADERARLAAEQERLREEANRKAEAERRARAAKAEADRKAKEKAEAQRLAQKKAEAEAVAEKAKQERLALARAEQEAMRKKAEAEAAAEKAKQERLALAKAEQEAAQKKAEAEAAAAKAEQDRLAQEKAEAERQAKEEADKQRLAKEVDKEAENERRAKIKKLDDAFAAYTLDYRKRMDEALKPGTRIDPTVLQQEYLLKKRDYRAARKLLEKKQ